MGNKKNAPLIDSDYPRPPEDKVRLKMLQELNQALSSGDAQSAVLHTGRLARDYSIGAIANGTGLNRAQLYRTLGEDGNPAFSSVVKIYDVMGLRMMVLPKYG